ncbi:MAG: hypothetical protein ACM3ML_38065 [Micromonosporaceae bacterium]
MQAPWLLAYLIVTNREANVRTGRDRRAAQGRAPRRRNILRRNASCKG